MDLHIEVKRLIDIVRKRLPGVTVQVERPALPEGIWWADFDHDGHVVALQYHGEHGFGMSSLPTDGYGEGADETYLGVEPAAERVVDLLQTGRATQPQRVDALRRLRVARHLTQAEMARLLAVRQPSVSKAEKRGDCSVVRLRQIVEALGGHLEVRAEFGGNFIDLLGPE